MKAARRADVAIVAGALVLAALPLAGLPAFYDSLGYLFFHWIVLATSWNLLSGYAGYFSFGHGAFFGVGLYTSATLAGRFDWPFLATLPVAAVVPAAVGVALGAVVFRVKRVRGELFALLTLAVTFVIATIVLNTPIDGGPGIYLNAVPMPKIGPTPSSSFYLLALALAVLALWLSHAIHGAKLGAGLFAIHDDEDAAEVMGVPTYRAKLVAFALSSGLAGVAGGVHALFISYVTANEVFNITVPLTVVLMSVLGGARHWAGPAVGAVLITALLYAFTGGEHAVLGKAAIGAVLVAAILFMPDGVLGRLRARRDPGPAAAARAPAPVAEAAVPVAEAAAAVVPLHAPGAVQRSREPLLAARGLSKSFRGLRALDGVDLDVWRGEILGLIGPNGSGKSTFINVVSGHYAASGGEVRFEGRRLTGMPAHRIAQAGLARTYQIPRPFKHLDVSDNVAIAAMFGGSGMGRAQAEREATLWLQFTALARHARSRPHDLNLHERKFLELARALASRPRLVLLDEVLCGLTPTEMHDAIALIRRIRDQGTTIVFVEHVMHAVLALTDRVVVFDQGRVLAQGTASNVMRRPDVMAAYLGRAAHA